MNPELLDVVAILRSIAPDELISIEPEYGAIELPIGLVGTIIEIYQHEEPYQYLIEFSHQHGNDFAMAILPANELFFIRTSKLVRLQNSNDIDIRSSQRRN